MVSERHFLLADAHAGSPQLSAANYAFEEKIIPRELQQVQRGLQVGCMNGTRVVRFSKAASCAHVDGLEISRVSVVTARKNVRKAGLNSEIFHGDITAPPAQLKQNLYDFVYALNNTLGYIPEAEKAIRNMQAISKGRVALSVFSDERFTNKEALTYFASMEIAPSDIEIDGNTFYLPGARGAKTAVRRFSREEVLGWGSKIKETPLGFYAILSAIDS